MNRNLVTKLSRSIVQNVTGRLPAAQITAPDRERAILSMNSEEFRMRQFEYSREFHARRFARENGPGMDYDSELADGFALKYQG